MSLGSEIGKKAEDKIKEWLDRPDDGISYTRLFDQLSGFYQTSRNICDFIVYEYPYQYFIESKATYGDRFDFSMIQPHQKDGLLMKSKIYGCFGLIIVLFATYKRAFILDIRDINDMITNGKKSINIKKINKWFEQGMPYIEISTIPNSRKKLLDYTGDIEDLVIKLQEDR